MYKGKFHTVTDARECGGGGGGGRLSEWSYVRKRGYIRSCGRKGYKNGEKSAGKTLDGNMRKT